MRRLWIAGLAASSLLSGGAALADDSDFRPPADGRYVIVNGGNSDAGPPVASYVALPDHPAGEGVASFWMVDVFRGPMNTPKGAGVYSSALWTIDCKQQTDRIVKGALFGADGAVLYSQIPTAPVQPVRPGTAAERIMTLVCGARIAKVDTINGLAAVIVDGQTRPDWHP
jgi:hypothetical protein